MAGMCAPEHYGIYKYSRFYGASGYPTGVVPSRHSSGSMEGYCMDDYGSPRPRSNILMHHEYQPRQEYQPRHEYQPRCEYQPRHEYQPRPRSAREYQPCTGYGLRPSSAPPVGVPTDPQTYYQVVGGLTHPTFVINPEWRSERLPSTVERRNWAAKYGHLLI